VSVESVITVETLQSLQETQTKTEAAIALGVEAAKKQPKARAARIEEVRARIEAGTYRPDNLAIAQKMLEIDIEERN
jgi:anti-sigma28 factor (negative regulator of flagellin synthesis)